MRETEWTVQNNCISTHPCGLTADTIKQRVRTSVLRTCARIGWFCGGIRAGPQPQNRLFIGLKPPREVPWSRPRRNSLQFFVFYCTRELLIFRTSIIYSWYIVFTWQNCLERSLTESKICLLEHTVHLECVIAWGCKAVNEYVSYRTQTTVK